MRGPETPPVLRKASDRLSRSRIWTAVHRHAEANGISGDEPGADEAVESGNGSASTPIRLGLRGTPTPQPRRGR
jgi:hypothetical protein